MGSEEDVRLTVLGVPRVLEVIQHGVYARHGRSDEVDGPKVRVGSSVVLDGFEGSDARVQDLRQAANGGKHAAAELVDDHDTSAHAM